MNQSTNRRHFLKRTVAAGAVASGYFVNPIPAAESKSPNEKLDLAFVGVGGKGWHNVQQLTSENVAVLCDVDAKRLAKAAEKYPQARQYRDFRRMLDAEQKRIDAVVVSTPDHTHAPATSVALDLGKHVYCEKPLTHSVQEARAIAQLAKKTNVPRRWGFRFMPATTIVASWNWSRAVRLVA